MKEISLTRGLTAKVDDEDFDNLSRHNWYADLRGKVYYAMRAIPKEGGGQRKISMQSVLRECPEGCLVDHENGDSLDNQKDNLRVATKSQNRQNVARAGGKKSSRYKGVFRTRSKIGGRQYRYWVAKLSRKFLGTFPTEEDAAKAYDAAASRAYGEFARLNFPIKEMKTCR